MRLSSNRKAKKAGWTHRPGGDVQDSAGMSLVDQIAILLDSAAAAGAT